MRLLTYPSPLCNTEPSSLERAWKSLMLQTLKLALAFCFNLLPLSKSLVLCSITVIFTGDAEPYRVHCAGIFILRNLKDKWEVTCRSRRSYRTSSSLLHAWLLLASDRSANCRSQANKTKHCFLNCFCDWKHEIWGYIFPFLLKHMHHYI